MSQIIFMGLSALASMTGVASGADYPTTAEHINNISAFVETNVGRAQKSKFKSTLGENASYDELYDLYGENRYLGFSLDQGYLVYDKATSQVIDFSFQKENPYKNHEDDLKIYSADYPDFKYATYSEEKFINLESNTNLNEAEVREYFIMDSYQSNKFYPDLKPKDDAIMIPNAFYFQNLYAYHGANTKGSCCVVALQMFLGYYDTFLNDTIIDEQYDVHSINDYSATQNVREFTQSPGTDNSGEGKPQKNTDIFHRSLINLSKDEVGDDPEHWGMNTSSQLRLGKTYLNKKGIKYTTDSSVGNPIDIINNTAAKKIKAAIDNGRPVIANSQTHSTIAFGYDSEYVYVHTGWGWVGGTPWSTFRSGIFDDYFVGMIDINIELGHSHSDNYYSSYHKTYLCPCGFRFTNTFVTPVDYYFEPQYFFYEKDKQINTSNLSFRTRRLRTGYIENEYINLSARREGAGTAYLEYFFPIPIKRVTVKLAFWSASEQIYSPEYQALFQYKNSNGNWITRFDFMHETSLTNNRKNPTEFTFGLPAKTYEVRFYSTALATGSNNKGRLCIGDMQIIYI